MSVIENWVKNKEEICIRLRLALSSFDEQDHYDKRFQTIGKLIVSIQMSSSPEALNKILASAIRILNNDPDCSLIQFILTTYLESNVFSSVSTEQLCPAKLLQTSCLVTANLNEINLDFSPWLNCPVSINGQLLNHRWKNSFIENKRSWLSRFNKTKQQKIMELTRYLSSVGMAQSAHPFIFQALSTTGIRTVANLYLNGIEFYLHINDIPYDNVSYSFRRINIKAEDNRIILEQELRFEINGVEKYSKAIYVKTSAIFELGESSLSPRLTHYKAENIMPDGNFPNEVLNANFNVGDNSQNNYAPEKMTFVNCSRYIENMEYTKELSLKINKRYFLMTVPCFLEQKQYYLVDTNNILGEGGYGKIFQAYNVNKQNPIASSASPKFAAKRVHTTLFDSKEMALSKPHITIYGSIMINDDYSAYYDDYSYHDEYSHYQEGYCMILLEYIPGQTISRESLSNFSVSLTDRLRMIVQLATQVQTFHDLSIKFNKRIVHCDLKLDNVMFYRNDQERINLRIIDFGVSHVMPETSKSLEITPHSDTDFSANPKYSAPEMLNRHCGFSSDIFMMAPIIATLLGEKDLMLNKEKFERKIGEEITSKSPLKQQIQYASATSSYDTIFNTLNYHNPNIKQRCRKFLSLMSHAEPNKRPKIQAVVEFFTQLKNDIRENVSRTDKFNFIRRSYN